MLRPVREVAVQSIIYGTLGFRASLEVTDHPKAVSVCPALLPWLDELNIGSLVEPFHREILAAQHGTLPPDSQTESYWRGESAALLAWTISLFDRPPQVEHHNPNDLVDKLQLLQPAANELLEAASFRPVSEIEEFSLYCLEIRHQFQLNGLPFDAREGFRRIHQVHLVELGLASAQSRSEFQGTEAGELLETSPHVKGLYSVRSLTIQWLFGQDSQ